MKRLLITLLTIPTLSLGQVNLNVIKYSKDSVNIFLDEGVKLKMNEPYNFVVRTNITAADNIVLSVKQDTALYDGMKFTKTFVHYQYGFFVKRDNKIIGTQKIIELSGTKYEVKIDGTVITRYKPNKVDKNSIIEIELKSDTEDLSNLTTKQNVLLYWTQDKRTVRQFELIDLKTRVDFSNEKTLIKRYNPKLEMNFLVIQLPQVYDKNGKELLAIEAKERTYLLGLE